tara:strand:- start:18205 stop:18399 length:195 start_codon:yes stop_codon:yes gene_type:complete
MNDRVVDELKEFYHKFTGEKLNLNARWTSLEHVNIRRLFLKYREYKKLLTNDVGIVKIIKKHHM